MRRTSVVNAVQNWLRRALAIAAVAFTLPALAVVVGGTPSANAFSREGLPVDYLDVYSASMGRNNGTRLWIYCAPGGSTSLDDVDVDADPNQAFNAGSLEGMAIKSNNATFVFPASGNHAWPYWGQQLNSLKPDLIATLNG